MLPDCLSTNIDVVDEFKKVRPETPVSSIQDLIEGLELKKRSGSTQNPVIDRCTNIIRIIHRLMKEKIKEPILPLRAPVLAGLEESKSIPIVKSPKKESEEKDEPMETE